jgi:TRAP-type C4-dicarboxylate transport system substrate-binding protein
MQDFKGARMRVYNAASERMAYLVGAQPTTIQVIDLGKAIDAGEFDLMFTSSWTAVDATAWSKMKYYYQVNAWLPKNMVFISRKVFESLDQDSQQKLLTAARVAEERGWLLSRDMDRAYEEQIRAQGVRLATIAPDVRTSLDRVGLTIMREWLRRAGKGEMTLLMRYSTERARN